MGFFGEVAACEAQALAVPFWLLGTGLRWIVWILVAGLLPGVWRLLWFLIVCLAEWGAWRSTLSCLKDRLVPYQQAIVLGVAPVLASRVLVSPYLLDPVRGYMPVNYPYSPPSMLFEYGVRIGFLVCIWRLGYGALLRARSERACQSIAGDWEQRAWSITGAMLFTYLFLLITPFMYTILYFVSGISKIVPFFKDLVLSLVMGLSSFFWFTTHADKMTSDACRV